MDSAALKSIKHSTSGIRPRPRLYAKLDRSYRRIHSIAGDGAWLTVYRDGRKERIDCSDVDEIIGPLDFDALEREDDDLHKRYHVIVPDLRAVRDAAPNILDLLDHCLTQLRVRREMLREGR